MSGFRFRKRVTIMPGLKLNLSFGGVSATVGGRYSRVTVGKRGITPSASLGNGSGISYVGKTRSWSWLGGLFSSPAQVPAQVPVLALPRASRKPSLETVLARDLERELAKKRWVKALRSSETDRKFENVLALHLESALAMNAGKPDMKEPKP